MKEYEKAVRKAMIDQEITVTALADELGVSRQAIYLVMWGQMRSPKIREAINKKLQIKE